MSDRSARRPRWLSAAALRNRPLRDRYWPYQALAQGRPNLSSGAQGGPQSPAVPFTSRAASRFPTSDRCTTTPSISRRACFTDNPDRFPEEVCERQRVSRLARGVRAGDVTLRWACAGVAPDRPTRNARPACARCGSSRRAASNVRLVGLQRSQGRKALVVWTKAARQRKLGYVGHTELSRRQPP